MKTLVKTLTLKSLILILLTVFSASFALGQKVAVKGGVNLSRLTKHFANAKTLPEYGYHFGLDFFYGEKVFVFSGIHYYHQQYGIVANNQSTSTEISREILGVDFLKVPFNIGACPVNTEAIKWQLYLGATINRAFKMDDNSYISQDEDTFEEMFFGGNAGTRLQFFNFFVDINYEMGLTNIFRDFKETKTDVISLSVGYVF